MLSFQNNTKQQRSVSVLRPVRFAAVQRGWPIPRGTGFNANQKNTRQTQEPRQPVGGSDLSGMVLVVEVFYEDIKCLDKYILDKSCL